MESHPRVVGSREPVRGNLSIGLGICQLLLLLCDQLLTLMHTVGAFVLILQYVLTLCDRLGDFRDDFFRELATGGVVVACQQQVQRSGGPLLAARTASPAGR